MAALQGLHGLQAGSQAASNSVALATAPIITKALALYQFCAHLCPGVLGVQLQHHIILQAVAGAAVSSKGQLTGAAQ